MRALPPAAAAATVKTLDTTVTVLVGLLEYVHVNRTMQHVELTMIYLKIPKDVSHVLTGNIFLCTFPQKMYRDNAYLSRDLGCIHISNFSLINNLGIIYRIR
jgi:phosphoketolase